MSKSSEILETQEVADTLSLAAKNKVAGVMTYLVKGKWARAKVVFGGVSAETLYVEVIAEQEAQPPQVQIDQPVGMSFAHESQKYIFETAIAGFEPKINQGNRGRIILMLPDRIERMRRRADLRVNVPDSLKVKVLFWHRGYHDDSIETPLENYWQGRLVDLSAGGVQISVDLEQEPNFKVGQLVGIQFTPMPYTKPLIVEGQVKHIARSDQERALYLGVRMMGLEASNEGRQKLHRIVSVVSKYQEESKTENASKDKASNSTHSA